MVAGCVCRSTSTSTWSSLSSSPLSSLSISSPTGRLLPRPPNTRLTHSSPWQPYYAPTRSRLARHDKHLVRPHPHRHTRTHGRERGGRMKAFVRNPWNWLDVVLIVVSLASLGQARSLRTFAAECTRMLPARSEEPCCAMSAGGCRSALFANTCARELDTAHTRSISTSYEANMCLHYCHVSKDTWHPARSATSTTRLRSNRVELN